MSIGFPQRRLRGLNRWHIMGLAIWCVGAMLIVEWVDVKPADRNAQAATMDVAPTDQTGKPLRTE